MNQVIDLTGSSHFDEAQRWSSSQEMLLAERSSLLDARESQESPLRRSTEPAERPLMLAAVDLGSNSFRMVIARRVGDEIRILDRLREGVRLAAHLDHKQRLTPEGKRRALSCLRKFGQRVRDFPRGSVRAVGTNTLRKARKTSSFLAQAEKTVRPPDRGCFRPGGGTADLPWRLPQHVRGCQQTLSGRHRGGQHRMCCRRCLPSRFVPRASTWAASATR